MFAASQSDSRPKIRALVVGGANVDIKCHIDGVTTPATSNPGHVRVSLGGVGRNIAQNLALLGCEVTFLTAIGADSHGEMLRENCKSAGITLHALTTDLATGTYTAVLDASGDLVIAVAAMSLMERLTPEALAGLLPPLDKDNMLIVDANLPERSVHFLANLAKKNDFRFIFEPVSVPKCQRIRPVLQEKLPVFLMSPNRDQLAALAGVEISDQTSLAFACARLHACNVKNLIVGLGPKGAYWSDGAASGYCPALETAIVDATGGGDAALAGALFGLARGLPLELAARIGQRTAALAVSCAETVNAQITPDILLQDIL